MIRVAHAEHPLIMHHGAAQLGSAFHRRRRLRKMRPEINIIILYPRAEHKAIPRILAVIHRIFYRTEIHRIN